MERKSECEEISCLSDALVKTISSVSTYSVITRVTALKENISKYLRFGYFVIFEDINV